jgi:hypothetical protein
MQAHREDDIRRLRAECAAETAVREEAERDVGRLREQCSLLKADLRRLERSRSRADVSREYLKNTVLPFVAFPRGSREQRVLLPVVSTLLQLDDAEATALREAVFEGKPVSAAFAASSDARARMLRGGPGVAHMQPHHTGMVGSSVVGANELHKLRERAHHTTDRRHRPDAPSSLPPGAGDARHNAETSAAAVSSAAPSPTRAGAATPPRMTQPAASPMRTPTPVETSPMITPRDEPDGNVHVDDERDGQFL